MKKNSLKGISESLMQRELRNVLGGSGFPPGGSDTCTGVGKTCDGNCPDKWVWDSKKMIGVWESQSCYTAIISPSTGHWACACA